MKRACLCIFLLSIASLAKAAMFTNTTSGVQTSTPTITPPPTLYTSLTSLPPWFDLNASLEIGSAFSGPGIDASLSSYCVASQLNDYSSQVYQFMLESTPDPPDVYSYTISSHVIVTTADFMLSPNLSYAPPCCGFCNVWAANARVFYWPTPNPVPNITTVVDSTGFTFTSPSAYVRYGNLQAYDNCATYSDDNLGDVGTVISLTTLAFQPTELSTIRKAYGIDENIGTYQLDFRDWGTACTSTYAKTSTAPDGVVGIWDPCFAILAIPSRVLALEDAWSTCAPGAFATGVHDPPYALLPVAGPLAAPTTGPSTPWPSIIASPAQDPSNPAMSTPPPVPSQSTAAVFYPSTEVSIDLPTTVYDSKVPNTVETSLEQSLQTDLGPPNSSDPPSAQAPSGEAALPAQGTVTIGGLVITAPSYGASVVTIGTAVLSSNDPLATISNVQVSLGSDAIIIGTSTILFAGPASSTMLSSFSRIQTPIVLGGTAASPAISGLVSDTPTVDPGQPAVTISRIPISLGSPSIMVAESTVQPIGEPALATIAGQLLTTAGPSGVLEVAGTTLAVGGPAVTISGTPVSLAPSGVLVIGSSTETLPLHPTPSEFAVGSVTVSLDPSNIVIGGVTLTPGGPAITVDGVLVSLGSSDLVVGTKTETFLPGWTSSPGGLGGFIMSGVGEVGGSPVTATPSETVSVRPFVGKGGKAKPGRMVLIALVVLTGCIMYY